MKAIRFQVKRTGSSETRLWHFFEESQTAASLSIIKRGDEWQAMLEQYRRTEIVWVSDATKDIINLVAEIERQIAKVDVELQDSEAFFLALTMKLRSE